LWLWKCNKRLSFKVISVSVGSTDKKACGMSARKPKGFKGSKGLDDGFQLLYTAPILQGSACYNLAKRHGP